MTNFRNTVLCSKRAGKSVADICHFLYAVLPSLLSSPVEEEVLGQPLWSDDLEDDLVGLQGLAVDTAGESGVQTLGQPLSYGQLLGHYLVLGIVLQNLGKTLRRDIESAFGDTIADWFG